MNCQEARDLVEDALDKRLSGGVKRRLDLHLARCRDCRRFYEAEQAEHTRWFRAMNDAEAEPPHPLPPDFADRLVAAVMADDAANKASFFRRFHLPRWLKRAACFAVLLSGAAFAATVVVDAVVGSGGEATKGTIGTEGTPTDSETPALVSDVVGVPVAPSVSYVPSNDSLQQTTDNQQPATGNQQSSSDNQFENEKGETEMKQINGTMKAAALALAVTGASAANGSTIAWYRFNEGTMGCKVGSSVTIENSANPGVFTGKCQYQKSDIALGESEDEACLPIATNAFPIGIGVQNSQEQAKYPNERALWFHTAHYTWSGQLSDTGKGATVTVPRNGAFAPSSFTVECFFKSVNGNNWQQGNLQTLVALPGSWKLEVQKDGKLYGSVTASTGNTKTLSSPSNTSAHDRKWHHAAITFDGETKVFRLYFDYELAYYGTADGDVAYNASATTPLAIGCSPDRHWNGKWNGFIDEVRITDTALSADDFLRNAAYNDEINAPSTVCYVPFQNIGVNTYFGYSSWVNLNCLTVFDKPSAYISWNSAAQAPSIDTTTIPAQNLYGATADINLTIQNANSMHFATNGSGLSASLFIDDRKNGAHTVLGGSFTAELFIRAVEPPNQIVGYRKPYILCYGNRAFYIELAKNNGGTVMFGVDSTAFASRSGLCDGNWHHVAFVYDRDAHIVKAYVDYVRIGTTANMDIGLGNIDAYHSLIQVGGGYGLSSDAYDIKFNGWIDEFRLSNRALSKAEFLSSTWRWSGTKVIVR